MKVGSMNDLKTGEIIQPVFWKQLTGFIIFSLLPCFLGYLFSVLTGLCAFIDAWKSGIYKRKDIKSIVNISPMGWGIVTGVLFPLGYPFYLMYRNKLKTKEGGNLFYVLTIILGGILLSFMILNTIRLYQ
jgi:hypothetical protein